jgi:hypoxanthine phosphoribosyltransferase
MITLQKDIQLHELIFEPYISAPIIHEKVNLIAHAINHDYAGAKPLIIVVMNGAFVFAADLVRQFDIECDIMFVNIKSYNGTISNDSAVIQWDDGNNIVDRDIIIIEDIIDTGKTMAKLIPFLQTKGTRSVEVAAIFIKPDAAQHDIQIKYAGISIPDRFVVGYGLDYNGLGRNLKDVYQLKS